MLSWGGRDLFGCRVSARGNGLHVMHISLEKLHQSVSHWILQSCWIVGGRLASLVDWEGGKSMKMRITTFWRVVLSVVLVMLLLVSDGIFLGGTMATIVGHLS
jgi:hypothetical protein